MKRNNETEKIREVCKIISILSENNSDEGSLGKFIQNVFGYEMCADEEFKRQAVDSLLNIRNDYAEKCEDNFCKVCELKKWCKSFRTKAQKNEDEKAPKYIDFFCGAGGLSLGFEQEGFVLSLANDIDDSCIETYAFNHVETPKQFIIKGDINDVIKNLEKYERYEDVDVVIGGPPCQGFSMANRQRLIDDPRNHLYKSYIAAIKKINPSFVVMENVKGMLGVQDQIKDDFAGIGYQVEARILNARNFGVPQNRERVIFIGNRVGIDNNRVFETLNSLIENAVPTVLKDAIFDLPPIKAKNVPHNTELESDDFGYDIAAMKTKNRSDYIKIINSGKNAELLFNHKARFNNDRDIAIFGILKPGEDSTTESIQKLMPYKRRAGIFKDKYFKLDESKPSKTITAHMKYDCNMYIHPAQARGLSPREAARIQSYPDDYFFRGAYTKTYMQIGNSVPPLMSRYIAKAIKGYL